MTVSLPYFVKRDYHLSRELCSRETDLQTNVNLFCVVGGSTQAGPALKHNVRGQAVVGVPQLCPNLL